MAEAPLSLQLYLSQLPFDTDKGKIVNHFESHGCTVSRSHGIRLLREKGVAFIDAVDKEAHAAGLKLHRKGFGGRIINVRPVKTKQELAHIVETKKAALLKEGLEYKVTKDGSSVQKKRRMDEGQSDDAQEVDTSKTTASGGAPSSNKKQKRSSSSS